MNFVTEALELLEELRYITMRKPGYRYDTVAIQLLINQLRNGVKFLLPLHGNVGIKSLDSELFKLMKCPYPTMVFEYETTDKLNQRVIDSGNEFYHTNSTLADLSPSSKRLIVVTDGLALDESIKPAVMIISKSDSLDGVLLQPISYFDTEKLWIPSPIGVWVPRENAVEELVINGKVHHSFKSITIPLMPDTINDLEQTGFNLNTLARDCHEEVSVTIATLLAINARNVQHISLSPSDKLNKKRRKNRKEPFYEYKVLDIFLGKGIRNLPSGKGRRQAAIQQWLKNPSKLHSVIGHFKHRRTGIFWWHSHMRGDADRGAVIKEYNLKAR